MKTTLVFLVCMSILAYNVAHTQDLNWAQIKKEQQHVLAIKSGIEYASFLGLSYGYRPGASQSIWSAEISSPFGKDLLDDWKVQVAYQRQLWQQGNFGLNLKPGLLLRKYNSYLARALNIGVDLHTAVGYYRPKWFLAAEAKVDQTLATNLKQGFLKEQYPEIYEGWVGYTGGNYKFGVQGGYALGKQQLALRLGKVYGANFKDNPTIPFYVELSLSKVW